jgi:hypothetical protein
VLSPSRPASRRAELSCPRSGSPTRRLSAAERHAIEYSRTAEQHEQQPQHHHHHHDQHQRRDHHHHHLHHHDHHQQQQQPQPQQSQQQQQTARQQYAAHTAQLHLAQAKQAKRANQQQQQQQQQQRRQRQQQQLEPLPQRPTTSPGLPSLTRPFRTEASASASMPTSPLRAALDRIARHASPSQWQSPRLQWQSPLGTAPQLTQPAARAVASATTTPSAIPAPACAAPQLARSPSRSTTAYHHCLGSTTTFQGAFYQREVVR